MFYLVCNYSSKLKTLIICSFSLILYCFFKHFLHYEYIPITVLYTYYLVVFCLF